MSDVKAETRVIQGAAQLSVPQIVYYAGLWYSREMKPSFVEFSTKRVRYSLREIVFHLKLLAILFPVIYIPRSHFLTKFGSIASDLALQVLNDPDIRYLIERGIIKTSTMPSVDSQSDTERVNRRVRRFTWLQKPTSEILRGPLTEIEPLVIDSLGQAQNNISLFDSLTVNIEIHDRRLAIAHEDIIKRSQYSHTPFFHERYVRYLFDAEVFSADEWLIDRLWRESNSEYLRSGLNEFSNAFVYYNPDFESSHHRFIEEARFDRLLYNPNTFHSFISLFLSVRQQVEFDMLPISDLFSAFSELELEEFRLAYFAMAKDVSMTTYGLARFPGEESLHVDDRVPVEFLKAFLKGRLDGVLSDLSGGFATGIKYVARTIDPATSLATELTAAALKKPFGKGIERALLRFRHRHFLRFMEKLCKLLPK